MEDGRSMRAVKGSLGHSPSRCLEQRRGWSLMIFCARATRGLRRMGWAAWSSSCARRTRTIEDRSGCPLKK